jgi:hypothetical protein
LPPPAAGPTSPWPAPRPGAWCTASPPAGSTTPSHLASATPTGRPTVARPFIVDTGGRRPDGYLRLALHQRRSTCPSRDERAAQDEGSVTERRAAARNTAEYAPNMTQARGNRALVIGHRLVTHAAERAGTDPHQLTSCGASAQLRRDVTALASTGEHGSPLSLNQRVVGSTPTRRTSFRRRQPCRPAEGALSRDQTTGMVSGNAALEA